MNSSSAADYTGARGSNAGDQFHEFWALEQVLGLLRPGTSLKAVTVEGVASESAGADQSKWEGVDCGLYYGAATLEHADAIDLAQLKYSSADSDKSWTVARLVASSATKTSNSVIRRLADAFKAAKSKAKRGAAIKVRLITNQPASDEITNAFAARWSGSLADAGLDAKLAQNLQVMRKASGLTEEQFAEFVSLFDLSGAGQTSRFATKANVVALVTGVLGDDVSSEVRELQTRIRDAMLPEAHRDVITEKILLTWFDLGTREGLFPAPPDIVLPTNRISRPAAGKVVDTMVAGQRLILLQGEGGCGKTTLMQEISERLPEGSVSVLFDCFGGGRCVHSDDKRHLAENAFLQMTNDLAVAMELPLFIPRNNKHPATVRSFIEKLRIAGDALKLHAPDAILLMKVDAADNSVSAAESASEKPFVFDLVRADFNSLPDNVRIIVSARTARSDKLNLPTGTPKIDCPPFERAETQLNLEKSFGTVTSTYVDQFHALSNHNPRVQSYAIGGAEGDKNKAMDLLLPSGKTLPDVLKKTFDLALKRHGQEQLFDKLVAALAFLPAPATLAAVARLADTTEAIVRDFVTDLHTGLRLNDYGITIADEDFDGFIKERSEPRRSQTLQAIATQFLSTYRQDAYSSLHLADALMNAGRAGELLQVIQDDPQPKAISDPILRRQVQVRRLKFSLAACQSAGSATDALKTVLISAEAERDDTMLTGVMMGELDLSVDFGGASLRRSILLDRDRVADHGSFLAHDARCSALNGNHVRAREDLHSYDAWMKRRQRAPKNEIENWKVTDRDVAARSEAILEIAGAEAAVNDLLRWTPRNLPVRIAQILVPQLLASRRADKARAILAVVSGQRPWDLTVSVPLALSGEPVDATALARSLRGIRRRFIPSPDALTRSYQSEDNWTRQLLDTYVTACELGFLHNVDPLVLSHAITNILDLHGAAGKRTLYRSDHHRFDAVIRLWLLRAAMDEKVPTAKEFADYIESLSPPTPPPPKSKGDKERQRATERSNNEERDRRARTATTMFPIYQARVAILAAARAGGTATPEQIGALGNIGQDSYRFDEAHDSMFLRQNAAQSVMSLLGVSSLDPQVLGVEATKLLSTRFADPFATRKMPIWRAMLLRESAAATVIGLADAATKEIKDETASASDKLEALIRLARLVRPASRPDAEVLFNSAVQIAKDIDTEAIDQIAFLSHAASRAKVSDLTERRRLASLAFSYVTAAAGRLDRDGFPWRSGITAMTRLDPALALAAIGTWADRSVRDASRSLIPFLETGLDTASITVETAIALALLIDDHEHDLLNKLVPIAAADPANGKHLLDELSRRVLLLNPRSNRVDLAKTVANAACADTKPDGPWLTDLKRMIAFFGTLNVKPPKDEPSSLPSPALADDKDDTPKKAYVFDPKGKTFLTSAAIAAELEAARAFEAHYSEIDLLKKMRDVSSTPADRAAFLTAVGEVPEDIGWFNGRAQFITETVGEWRGSPSVDAWVKDRLPTIIVTQFSVATRYLKDGYGALPKLLDLAQLDTGARQRVIFEGLAKSGSELGSRTLFGIADLLVHTLSPVEAADVLAWYAQRLFERLPANDRPSLPLAEIPKSVDEAIGRLLFALMTDVDTRIRWRAAHALRRLALLGRSAEVAATFAQHARTADPAYRRSDAPYYHLAGKLWLLLAIYRISAETPDVLKELKAPLIDIATSRELPHVAIREYAKQTALQLAAAGTITLSAAEAAAVTAVNMPEVTPPAKERSYGRHFGREGRDDIRFKYDELDTLRYWYTDILRIFPTAAPLDVLKLTDRWIMHQWGTDAEANYWDKEPRKSRYNERRFGQWSHGHGEMPTLEKAGTYLEWHAMQCAIGELLRTHPTNDEAGWGSYEDWVRKWLPSAPPEWLSDHRGPTPLAVRLWTEDERTDKGWLQNLRLDEFQSRMIDAEDGWICVADNDTSRFPKREEEVSIDAALVSPATASALARALQAASNSHDFRIPAEGDDLQFDDAPYRLQGWIAASDSDRRFDDRDPFRYEVSTLREAPGTDVSKVLGLRLTKGTRPTWIDKNGESAFRYIAWCDEPSPEDDQYDRRMRSDGWGLSISPAALQTYLREQGMDLICKVSIDRGLRNEYSRSYDPNNKKKTGFKIIILRADGTVEDSEGRIGTWQDNRKRAWSRSGR